MTLNRGLVKSFKDILFRTTYTQAFNLNKAEIQMNLLNFRKKNSNIYFGGYASGLYEYARLGQEMGINDVKFESVISWGDKMFNHYRKTIESQFKTKVFDTYGCTEGLMIAGQCHFGKYHILSPHIFLELLDENGNEVNVGEIGNVVVTRLDAFAMPLIRYRLGDLAIREAEDVKCECGKPFPILRLIVGRDTDLVRTPSGKNLIVHFFTGIMEHRTEIIQFQIVQEKADQFVLEYIPEREVLKLEDSLLEIHAEMEQKAGEKLNIVFKKVNQILPTPSGKPQIISTTLK
jgi:phenylacetate-CoA ligase